MNIELRKTVASALDNSDLNMDQRKAKGFDQAASPMRGRALSHWRVLLASTVFPESARLSDYELCVLW